MANENAMQSVVGISAVCSQMREALDEIQLMLLKGTQLGRQTLEQLECGMSSLRSAIQGQSNRSSGLAEAFHFRFGGTSVSKENLLNMIQMLGLSKDQAFFLVAAFLEEECHVELETFFTWLFDSPSSAVNALDSSVGKESTYAVVDGLGHIGKCELSPAHGLGMRVEELERQALSVFYLTTDFVAQVEKAALGTTNSIYELEEPVILKSSRNLICPRDQLPGTAYVHTLAGADHVGLANVMLSYTWGYTLGEIVQSLLRWCADVGEDLKRVYVWMCCVCNNQHRVKAKQSKNETVPFDTFRNVFVGRVQGIGRVIALMTPWDSPTYLTRAWCMLELHTAISLGDACELTIVMPPAQSEMFATHLVHSYGIETVMKALMRASIQNASAKYEEDKLNILRIVETETGFSKFDATLKRTLQQWFLRTASQYVQALPGNILDASLEVSRLMQTFDDLDSALQIVDFAFEQRQAIAASVYPDEGNSRRLDNRPKSRFEVLQKFGDLWHERGWLQHRRGDRTAAARLYSEGIDELEQIGARDGMPMMRLLRGRARAVLGDEADEEFIDPADAKPTAYGAMRAIADYHEALRILQAQPPDVQKRNAEDAAKLWNNLGIAYTFVADFAGAQRALQKAKRARDAAGLVCSHGNATRLYTLGTMHLKMARLGRGGVSQYEDARNAFIDCVAICKKQGTGNALVAKCDLKLTWLAQRGISAPAL